MDEIDQGRLRSTRDHGDGKLILPPADHMARAVDTLTRRTLVRMLLAGANCALATITMAQSARAETNGDWRKCRKCRGMVSIYRTKGRCPAGGRHATIQSPHYLLHFDEEPSGEIFDGARWCRKCEGCGCRVPTVRTVQLVVAMRRRAA